MFIKNVEICNILGVESANLFFAKGSSTYIVQCGTNCAIRSSFSTAVELIFSAKYARMESLINLKDIQGGFVRITFLVPRKSAESTQNAEVTSDVGAQSKRQSPSTSREAISAATHHIQQSQRVDLDRVHEIVACRDFRLNTADIIYSVDNAPTEQCSPPTFHGKFSTNVSFVFPYLEKMHKNTESVNLLKYVVEHIHYNWFQDQQTFNHLASNFEKTNSERIAFLNKHTTFFLNTILANNAAFNLTILKICQDIRTIFEYITCQEYTVWFFIPCQGKYIDMRNIISEDLDIDAIETCIQLKNCKSSRLIAWTDGDEGIKDLLLITLDIAVAFYSKTNLIFINQTDAIKEYQAMGLCTAAYLHKFNEVEATKWIKKNYLQHIIDVCNTLKVATVIDNVGGLPMPPINAHIIKCTNEPPYMTVSNPEPYNMDSIKERVNPSIINYVHDDAAYPLKNIIFNEANVQHGREFFKNKLNGTGLL